MNKSIFLIFFWQKKIAKIPEDVLLRINHNMAHHTHTINMNCRNSNLKTNFGIVATQVHFLVSLALVQIPVILGLNFVNVTFDTCHNSRDFQNFGPLGRQNPVCPRVFNMVIHQMYN